MAPCSLLRRRTLIAAALPAVARAEANLVRVATGEYPPYCDPLRPDNGLVCARVQDALTLGGWRVQFRFMPWARALSETAAGHFDLTAYWWPEESQPASFLRSMPLLENERRLVVRADHALRPGDRIGLVRAYTYAHAVSRIMRDGQLVGQVVNSDLAGLRMLLMGRLEALPVEPANACAMLRRYASTDEMRRLRLITNPVLDRQPGHVLAPRLLARSATLIDDLNAGLRRIATPLPPQDFSCLSTD